MSHPQASEQFSPIDSLDAERAPACYRRGGMGPSAGLVWGLVGGGIAWTLVWALDPFFLIPVELREVPVPTPPDVAAARSAALAETTWQNSLAVVGLLGTLLGGALAFGDGVSRRSLARTVGGFLLGAAVGCLFGVLGAGLGGWAESAYGAVGERDELPRTMLVQAVVFGTLGAGVGLVLGALSGRVASGFMSLVAGVLGGAFAAVVYPFLAAFLLPGATTETLVPGGDMNRLLWIGLVSALLGLTIPGLKWKRSPQAAAGSP